MVYFSESQKKSLTSSGAHSSRNLQDPNAFAVEKVSDLPKMWVRNVLKLENTDVCIQAKCIYMFGMNMRAADCLLSREL